MRPDTFVGQNYLHLLEQLKTYFPVPVSNPIMDGYFVHAISRFLDRLDDLKSAVPLLGGRQERHYHKTWEKGFPAEMS